MPTIKPEPLAVKVEPDPAQTMLHQLNAGGDLSAFLDVLPSPPLAFPAGAPGLASATASELLAGSDAVTSTVPADEAAPRGASRWVSE